MKKILILSLVILSSCFNKNLENSSKLKMEKGKGYLKEHLNAEEIARLKNIIKNAKVKEFEMFLNTHEDVLKNYPIIVKVMKTEIDLEGEKMTKVMKTEIDLEGEKMTKLIKARKKLNFNDAIWKVALDKVHDSAIIRKILTMKGKIKLPIKIKKTEVTPLMAIAYYAPEIIAEKLKRFVVNGAVAVNEKNEDGITALMLTVISQERECAIAAAKELIKAGADLKADILESKMRGYNEIFLNLLELAILMGAEELLNIKGKDKLLIKAIEFGRTILIEHFLKETADVKFLTTKGKIRLPIKGAKTEVTPLMAIAYHVPELIEKKLKKFVIKGRVDVNEKTRDGLTSLMLTVISTKREFALIAAKELIKAGANLKADILEAEARGYNEIFLNLLELAIFIGSEELLNVEDKEKLLLEAVKFGKPILVEHLLKRGTDAKYIKEQSFAILPPGIAPTSQKVFPLLYKAIEKNHLSIVKLLIINGALINQQDGKNDIDDSPLHIAAMFGRLEIAELLLQLGADVKAKNMYDITPLHKAASNGQYGIVELFIKQGAELDAQDRYGETPLHVAAAAGCLRSVELLLKSGASIDIRDKDEESVIYKTFNPEVLTFLAKKGAKIEISECEHSALYRAIKMNKLEAIRWFINRGADVNRKNGEMEDTVLHLAIRSDKLNIVKMLLKEGNANVNAANAKGITAIHLAAIMNDINLIEFLLHNGANVNNRDIYGNSALHWACDNGKLGLVDLLIREGADINAKNNCGTTPLDKAIIKGHTVLINILKSIGAKTGLVEIANKALLYGEDVVWLKLMEILKSGDTDVKKLELLSDFLTFKIMEGKICQMPAIKKAVEYGNSEEVITYLLETGFSINTVDNFDGNSALHQAIILGKIETVKLLLAIDEKLIKIEDAKCRTPLVLSMELEGREEIEAYLIDFEEEMSDRDAASSFSGPILVVEEEYKKRLEEV